MKTLNAHDPISTTEFTPFQEDYTMTTTTTPRTAKTRRALLGALAALGIALAGVTTLPAEDAAARPCIFPVQPEEHPLVCHLPRANGLAGGIGGGDSRANGLAGGIEGSGRASGLAGGMDGLD